MASPQGDHEAEGLRCDSIFMVQDSGRRVRILVELGTPPDDHEYWTRVREQKGVEACSGVLMENGSQGLGVRCSKSDCLVFHPLEALLRQAVEEGLVKSEQLEAIRKVVSGRARKSSKSMGG